MNAPAPLAVSPLPATLSQYAALIGIDWSDDKHALCLYDSATQQYERRELSSTPEAVEGWLRELRERFGGRPVAVVYEEDHGPLTYQLLAVEFLTLYLINPATAARYRETFTPSGAKDDPADAADLLDLLLKHPDRLRRLHPHDPQTRELARLCEQRRRYVEWRTAQVQRLGRELKNYFPQALSLVGENLTTNLACDFLRRWPSLPELQKARTATVRAFYYGHQCRSQTVLEQRLALLATAQPVTTDPSLVTPAVLNVQNLTAMIRTLTLAIAKYDTAIAALLAQHPEAPIFSSLPGAGPVFAARLTAFFGTDRSRYPKATDVQEFSGVAPILIRSGTQQRVQRRWRCPKFILQTFHEYANCSLHFSAWAKQYYQRQRDQGKKHHTAIRSLAFKWIRVIHACWRTRTPYDEARYLEVLRRHGSPSVPAATLSAATEKAPENPPKNP